MDPGQIERAIDPPGYTPLTTPWKLSIEYPRETYTHPERPMPSAPFIPMATPESRTRRRLQHALQLDSVTFPSDPQLTQTLLDHNLVSSLAPLRRPEVEGSAPAIDTAHDVLTVILRELRGYDHASPSEALPYTHRRSSKSTSRMIVATITSEKEGAPSRSTACLAIHSSLGSYSNWANRTISGSSCSQPPSRYMRTDFIEERAVEHPQALNKGPVLPDSRQKNDGAGKRPQASMN
ncbi:hypothetical protein GGX14DRAFT_576528 [Mycena pura]|uniref:Uncharacterized protein n=1 Tax=Mycena pura TaxID=153505 RepID=A0AAD6Y335_9AGAR|nr:hypothetical protein GGX14DRAFT_576528 [Mycena pura]